MATSSVAYNKPVLPRVSDTSDLASNRASVYSGKGLDFDGVNDKITTSLTTNIFQDQGTISGYLNIDDLSTIRACFGFRQNSVSEFYLLTLSGGNSEFRLRTTSGVNDVVTSLSAFQNKWTLFTCTFGDGTMSLYVDGALLASSPYTGTFIRSSSSYFVVGESGGNAFWLDGTASDIKVFDVALTANQVAELYNNPEQILPTGVSAVNLKLWLPMTEGGGYYVHNGSTGSIGTELVSNGGFDEVCQKWGLSDVATIAITGGKAVWTNPASGGAFADQYISATTGKTYRVTFDYSASDSGFVYVGDQYVSIPSGNGTFTADITYTSGNARVRFAYGSSSALTASIDNVSVKEVVPQATGTINGATWVAGLPEPLPQTALMDWNKATNRSEYSEDLTQTAWTKNGVTATAASIVSPLGTTGGVFNVVPSTTNAIHLIQDGSYSVSSGSYYVASAWFKANGYRYAFLSFSGYGNWTGSNGAEVIFDLYDGTASPTGGAPYDYGIEAYADGWYKCYTIAQATTSFSTNVNFFVSSLTSSNSFAGDGTSGLYMFGLQTQIATTVGTYVPTYASAQTSPVLIPKGLTTGKDIFGNSIAVPRSSGAFNFDGYSWAYIAENASHRLASTDNITLEGWFRYTSDGRTGGRPIFGKRWLQGNWLRFYYTDAGTLKIEGAGGGGQATTISPNIWYHIVGVATGGNTLTLYKDSVLIGSTTVSGYTMNFPGEFEIGIWSSENKANGQLSNVRVYPYALTAEQVADNYNQKATTVGATKTDSELQAYINRTISAGATVEDHANLLNTLTELDNKSGCL